MRFRTPRWGLLLVLPLLAGCAPKIGHVTGRVTYKGAPVPAGWIQFRPADPAKNSIPVELDADGNFAVDLPAGDVTVSIDNREWQPRPAGHISGIPAGIPIDPEALAKMGGGKAVSPTAPASGTTPSPRSGKYVAIPVKYYDLATSGLKFTVKGGPQTETLELTE